MKIEFTTTAYCSDDFALADFMDGMANNKADQAGAAMSFCDFDMSKKWVMVGAARISVDLVDAKEIQNGQLAALHAQLQQERADSQMRQNAILDRISKLQALEWQGVEA